jgi:hypothetical protein
MVRECKTFLEEISEKWKIRTIQEGKRIEKGEKKTRLEMAERKKGNYGKAGNKKLNAEEEEKIRNATMRKIELSTNKTKKGTRRQEKRREASPSKLPFSDRQLFHQER